MTNLKSKYSSLIGKDVLITGWSNNDQLELLDGVILSIEPSNVGIYNQQFKLSTESNSAVIGVYILDELIASGFSKANTMLNFGADAILNPIRNYKK
jgi:hypothetical protein